MFATFNYDFWPTVIVTLESHIIDDDDYEFFLKEWDDIYTKKTYFNFIYFNFILYLTRERSDGCH